MLRQIIRTVGSALSKVIQFKEDQKHGKLRRLQKSYIPQAVDAFLHSGWFLPNRVFPYTAEEPFFAKPEVAKSVAKEMEFELNPDMGKSLTAFMLKYPRYFAVTSSNEVFIKNNQNGEYYGLTSPEGHEIAKRYL